MHETSQASNELLQYNKLASDTHVLIKVNKHNKVQLITISIDRISYSLMNNTVDTVSAVDR